ncbi:YkgJ family cysteine cluster protein [Halogeometricum borinquense]|uniref:YkgJ family cysteine cluster protein n=1 Tax=Halogeometricum borinquense TaxID=60847 RepID=A0A482TSZ8_9EURY|nr:YkgJ family cysteine cluster protein [Halogeometricum borinquense]RYJ15079.1 YkgJ family cysteine cluster protein [Halogeometricum borinquense]
MKVNCEGCAGCCIDWRPVSPAPSNHERRGPREPFDDVYNLVPLTRDEIAAFVRDGFGDVLVPRMWEATPDADAAVEIDGVEVAAIGGKPAFFVGLRKPPKPVTPFGTERTWLHACVFLDPETLQCRIHGDEMYPSECRDYPGHNLALGTDSECERVEEEFGDDRLLDGDAPDVSGLLLGPHAVGSKVFAYPDPEALAGTVEQMRRGDLTDADRAAFVGVAVGSRPGSTDVDTARVEAVKTTVLEAESWAGTAAEAWTELSGVVGDDAADAPDGASVEVGRGAPETAGWDDAEYSGWDDAEYSG